jgi:hypothetical protein
MGIRGPRLLAWTGVAVVVLAGCSPAQTNAGRRQPETSSASRASVQTSLTVDTNQQRAGKPMGATLVIVNHTPTTRIVGCGLHFVIQIGNANFPPATAIFTANCLVPGTQINPGRHTYTQLIETTYSPCSLHPAATDCANRTLPPGTYSTSVELSRTGWLPTPPPITIHIAS